VALVAGLILCGRAPRTDLTRAALILWGGWTVLHYVTFATAEGTMHPYYTTALAPGIAALCGGGGVMLLRAFRTDKRWMWVLPAGLAATAAWPIVLLRRASGWHTWLWPTVGVVMAAAIAGLLVFRSGGRVRLLAASLAAAVVAALAGPAAYAWSVPSGSVGGMGGTNPTAGPSTGGGFGGGPGGGGGRGGFPGGGELPGQPGLFQTEDYARALFAYMNPEFPDSEVDLRVEHRMKRRVVIDGPEPIPYETVIHEAALRIQVAGRAASRTQLSRILEASEAHHVSVRVIPFALHDFAGAGSTMVYLGGAVPRLDTVVRDAPHGTAFVDSEAQLEHFRTLFRKVKEQALPPEQSRDLIHQLAKEL
jgi:hypothetical protein